MYDEQKRIPNVLMAGFIIAQLFVLIVVASLLLEIKKDETVTRDDEAAPKLAVEGLDDIEQRISDNDKTRIEGELLQKVKSNSKTVKLNSRAVINKDSLKNIRFESINLNYLSAVVDLPDLEQEYRIFFEYSNDQNNSYLTPNETLVVTCLDQNDKYKKYDFNCAAAPQENIYEKMAAKYLNYFRFKDFSASINPKKDVKTVNMVSMYGPKNAASYEQQCRSAISELGIDPNRFKYNMLSSSDLTYEYNPGQ